MLCYAAAMPYLSMPSFVLGLSCPAVSDLPAASTSIVSVVLCKHVYHSPVYHNTSPTKSHKQSAQRVAESDLQCPLHSDMSLVGTQQQRNGNHRSKDYWYPPSGIINILQSITHAAAFTPFHLAQQPTLCVYG